MADASTNFYSFTLPEVGGSRNTWGTKLNANWTLIDAILAGKLGPLSSVAGTNTVTASTTWTYTAYATNDIFVLVPANDNTGAVTLNINTLGAKAVYLNGGVIPAGVLKASQPVVIRYNGTRFDLLGAFDVAKLSASSNTFTGNVTTLGALGIGTTSPHTDLDIYGTAPEFVLTDVSGTLTRAGLISTGGNATLFADQEGTRAGSLIFSVGGVERGRTISTGYTKFSNDGNYINYTGADLSSSSYHVFNQTAENINIFAHTTSLGAGVFNYYSDLRAGAAGYHFRGRLNGSAVVDVEADGDLFNANGTYGTISDRKKKKDIKVNTTKRTDELKNLSVVNYVLTDDKKEKKLLGFVAQDFEQVFPGLVSESPDFEEYEDFEEVTEEQLIVDEQGTRTELVTKQVPVTKTRETGTTTKAIKTSLLIPILVQGFQEQQKQIELLESRLAKLENKQ